MPLQCFEHALQCSPPEPPVSSLPDPPQHLRGNVNGFSAASRRRLLRLLSTIRTSQLPPARFVTLTWHAVPDRWLSDARAFLQYVRRRGGWYLWRLEVQKRGAPHYHLIVWCADWDSADAEAAWHRIAGHGSVAHEEHGYDESEMESYGQVFYYVSKYVAKRGSAADVPDVLRGHRIWGASRDLPTTATGSYDPLTQSQYAAIRRLGERLIRARARAKGRRVRRRGLSPRCLHLYLRAGDAERIAAWVGADLVDPLWSAAQADQLAAQFSPRPPPPAAGPAAAAWHRGQASMFGPAPAHLRG